MSVSRTLIVEMNPRICAVVCTIWHKRDGCQAPRTAHMHGYSKDECPVGKAQADEWFRRPGRAGESK